MNELTKEQYEQVPEFLKDDYVLDGEAYKHAGIVEMKGTLNDLNSKLETQIGDFTTLSGKLSEFEASKAAEIEQARTEALKKAQKENNTEEVLRLEAEKIADAVKRANAETRAEVEQEYALRGVEATARQELTELVAGLKPINDAAARMITDHFKTRQRVEDGKIVYFNEDGSASSLDKSGMLEEAIVNSMFKPLSSYTPPTLGGGKMNGGDASSANISNQKLSNQKLSNKTQGYLANLT